MEVINLESSEDESASAPLFAKSTSFVNQDDNDDDASASSNDSIWDKKGLSTSFKRKSSTNPPDIDRPVKLGDVEAKALVGCCDPPKNAVQSSVKTKKYITQDSVEIEDHDEEPLPPEIPLNKHGTTWKMILLMDHREFGCRKDNFLPTVETNINNHFGAKHAEITTLPSADFLFVARLISKSTGEILDERVLDLVIERKNVEDLSQCLIHDSKKYNPLSFFEAQMYKLQHCGIRKKLFLMEDDEDRAACFVVGVKTPIERDKSLKRVKTIRKQIENGEFKGVEVLCTRNKLDTIKFLIRQLESFQKSFNPRRPPVKTIEQLKVHINEQMKNPTFLEYLRLRKQPGIGDVKAMKVIMDPSLDWDKKFVSPSFKKKTKATLEDRATFWNATSLAYIRHDHINIKISLSERERMMRSQAPSNWVNNSFASSSTKSNPTSKRPKLSSKSTEPAVETDALVQCGICCKAIDIWSDEGIVSCNRVAACGAAFHQMCLKTQNYDIHARDGCLKCNATSLLVTQRANSFQLDSSKYSAVDDGDDDDVIILD